MRGYTWSLRQQVSLSLVLAGVIWHVCFGSSVLCNVCIVSGVFTFRGGFHCRADVLNSIWLCRCVCVFCAHSDRHAHSVCDISSGRQHYTCSQMAPWAGIKIPNTLRLSTSSHDIIGPFLLERKEGDHFVDLQLLVNIFDWYLLWNRRGTWPGISIQSPHNSVCVCVCSTEASKTCFSEASVEHTHTHRNTHTSIHAH